jgi:ABC-type Mn2+/Zn2+ transport system permease subunit
MRIIALIALVSGVACGFILDGQVFNHAVIGLLCGVVATACAFGLARTRRMNGKSRTGVWIMACLGLAMVAICLLSLPSAYRSQEKFNKRLEEIRQTRPE